MRVDAIYNGFVKAVCIVVSSAWFFWLYMKLPTTFQLPAEISSGAVWSGPFLGAVILGAVFGLFTAVIPCLPLLIAANLIARALGFRQLGASVA